MVEPFLPIITKYWQFDLYSRIQKQFYINEIHQFYMVGGHEIHINFFPPFSTDGTHQIENTRWLRYKYPFHLEIRLFIVTVGNRWHGNYRELPVSLWVHEGWYSCIEGFSLRSVCTGTDPTPIKGATGGHIG